MSDTGALTTILGSVVLVATGEPAPLTGALTQPLDGISLEATGVDFAGGLTQPLGPITLAATGAATPLTGVLSRVLEPVTLAATGALATTGSLVATLGAVTLVASDTALMFFFAWTSEGVGFSAAMLREDEKIVEAEISEEEGGFATLTVEVKNPNIGLLAAGRNLWCWFSWRNDGDIRALFNGRLVGIPDNIHDETVRLIFVARPVNFFAQREAVAANLRVLPYVDPVWLAERALEPDTVLGTRAARWHIGRTDLVVTTSSIISGEAGTIEIGEAAHLYEDVQVSYGDAPLRRVIVVGAVSWSQQGAGDIDLTHELVAAFRASGSPYEYPVIASLSGDGLLSDWPAAGDDVGVGWTVGAGSTIAAASWLQDGAYVVRYIDKTENESTVYQNPSTGMITVFFTGWVTWEVAIPLTALEVSFGVHYEALRQRSETVTATIEASVQSLLVDPGATEEERIELASNFVGEPIDAGNAMPIGDLRRNSYFKIARGAQSFENIVLMARARLLARARAVRITFVTTWSAAAALTCRHNVRLLDRRLPGGEASGKVIAVKLRAAVGDLRAEITIGCAIGYGIALGAAAAGVGVYVEDGVLEPGIQARTGGQATLIAGELLYESFDNFAVTDDDGLNLFDMTARTVLNSLTVAGGPDAQRAAIDFAVTRVVPDPVGAVRDTPTVVTLNLKPVTGGAFHVDFAPVVSQLVVPKSINLEAV